MQDKYVGRTLTPASFQQTLYDFLHNGQMLFVPVLIDKLKALYSEITVMVGYRFYGASLLIVYDAFDLTKPIDVRLIDFTHCITYRELEENQAQMTYPPEKGSKCPDDGFLQGLSTLIHILESFI
jgi:inositol-hexakisphosphate kinase